MKKQKGGSLVRREKITALAFVSPLIIGFVVFTLICMVISFGWSFTNFNPISGRMKFEGFDRYIELFTHPTYKKAFLDSIVNTFGESKGGEIEYSGSIAKSVGSVPFRTEKRGGKQFIVYEKQDFGALAILLDEGERE